MECYVLIDHHYYRSSGLENNTQYESPSEECIVRIGKVTERLYLIFGGANEWNRNIDRVISWLAKNRFACKEVLIYAYYHTSTNGAPEEKGPTVYEGTYRTNSSLREEFDEDLFG